MLWLSPVNTPSTPHLDVCPACTARRGMKIQDKRNKNKIHVVIMCLPHVVKYSLYLVINQNLLQYHIEYTEGFKQQEQNISI